MAYMHAPKQGKLREELMFEQLTRTIVHMYIYHY